MSQGKGLFLVGFPGDRLQPNVKTFAPHKYHKYGGYIVLWGYYLVDVDREVDDISHI